MYNLSVIIPHYNSVNSLKKLLLSIPKRKNIQIIVVDDNSDQEFSINRDDEFNHILFLNNNTNRKGAGTCRNIGLNYATGQWILFADADDFFLEGFYDKLNKYFDSNNDVIFFKPTSVEIDTGKKSDRHIKYEKLIDDYLDKDSNETIIRLKFRFFVPWSKLIRNEFIQKNNILFDEVIASNDIMFSTMVGFYMKRFEVSEDVIYCVTRGYGTLTTNTDISVYDARVSIFIKYYKFLEQKLKKEEFKMLQPHGLGILVGAWRRRLGVKKIIEVYSLLKKNSIKVFNVRMLNPFFVIKQCKKQICRYLNEKKYLSKTK